MSVGTIVSTARYTTVTEIASKERGNVIRLDIRNTQDTIVLEEAVAIVGTDMLVDTINKALKGTGNHITLWKEA